MKEPTQDRKDIILAVVKGDLDNSYITLEEIAWLEQVVMDAVIEKLAATNPQVFSGTASDLTN